MSDEVEPKPSGSKATQLLGESEASALADIFRAGEEIKDPSPKQVRVAQTDQPPIKEGAVKDWLEDQIAKALVEFRDVRNQLIHPSGGSVTDALIASAVDSGIKLLRLLTGLRDINR